MHHHPIIPLVSLAITSIIFGLVHFNVLPNVPGGTLVGCVAFTLATAFAYWLHSVNACAGFEDLDDDASLSVQKSEMHNKDLNQNPDENKKPKASGPSWFQKLKKWAKNLFTGQGIDEQDQDYENNQENEDAIEHDPFDHNLRRAAPKSLDQKSDTLDSDMLKKLTGLSDSKHSIKSTSLIKKNNKQMVKSPISSSRQGSNAVSEDGEDDCRGPIIITAVVSTISTIALVSIIAILIYFYPGAFSYFWDMFKKNVVEVSQNQETSVMKSMYEKFMNLF